MHEYVDDLLMRISEKNYVMEQYVMEQLMDFDGMLEFEKLNQLTFELNQLWYEYFERLE